METTLEGVIRYLTAGLNQSLRELQAGLQGLSFADNFDSFEVTVLIPATSELAIRNQLKVKPSKRIIVRTNSATIVDGDTEWSKEYVYLKNTGALEATITVVFMR
jgi:hypothetical protein